VNAGQRFIVFVAKGFGSGCVPKAPGTFGSLAGLGLVALFLLLPGPLAYSAATLAGVVVSVWFCGQAERILNQKDPGSIVLDEIIALPLCFLPWVWREFATNQAMPSCAELFGDHWMLVVAVFAGFRFFDILKPWPIRQVQELPGGWGVTMDDVLAGLYVAALVWLLA